MGEWKTVEKDGMPKDSGCFLIKHYGFYNNPVKAYFFVKDGEFVLDHGGASISPTTIPIVATHWLRIPD